MLTVHRVCKGIGVCCVCGALFCHCLTEPEKDKYPYVPPQEHTYHETYVMQNFSEDFMTNASSSSHFSGEIHYNLSDMRANRASTDGWGVVTESS